MCWQPAPSILLLNQSPAPSALSRPACAMHERHTVASSSSVGTCMTPCAITSMSAHSFGDAYIHMCVCTVMRATRRQAEIARCRQQALAQQGRLAIISSVRSSAANHPPHLQMSLATNHRLRPPSGHASPGQPPRIASSRRATLGSFTHSLPHSLLLLLLLALKRRQSRRHFPPRLLALHHLAHRLQNLRQ